MHVLYLFAGVECKAEVRHYLTELAKRDNFCLKGLQLDILRNEGHDLHRDDVWSWVLQRLQSGEVDLFLVAPPCNTHSRARCQYRQHGGPRPLRDFNFPHGFPWLSNANKEKVLLADDLVQKSFQGCLVVYEQGHKVAIFSWNIQNNWVSQPGKSQPAFGTAQKFLSCCVKKVSVRLPSSNVSSLHLPPNPRVFSRRWILLKLVTKVYMSWMQRGDI